MWKQHKKISPRIDIEFWPPRAGVSTGAYDHFVTLAENFIYEYPFVVRTKVLALSEFVTRHKSADTPRRCNRGFFPSYKRRNFRLNLNVQLSAAPRSEPFDGCFTGNRRRRNNLFRNFFRPAIESVMTSWMNFDSARELSSSVIAIGRAIRICGIISRTETVSHLEQHWINLFLKKLFQECDSRL